MNRIAFVIAIMLSSPAYSQTTLPFEVQLDVIHQELSPDFCWFHPRVAAIPNSNSAAQTVICTLQKHLGVSDHYSGLYFMRSDDGGRTWSEPVLPPELDWATENGETIAVCDVTPGWHPQTGRIVAIGTKLRYSAAGEQLLDQPRSHQGAYAVYDPTSGKWTAWKMLRMPDEESQNYLVAPGCVQWLVRPDGTILLPMYVRGPSGTDYASTVLHCGFDGSELTLIEAGDQLKFDGGRGLCEPSLALFQGTYFLTLRNDAGGYVTTSSDGLHYAPIAPWTFDDGSELGSYNTQQHWLVHDQALFLSYTRRGANNDHIMRNRAPLFIAQIDPVKKQVIRSSEKILIPERGAMLGNFGATAISSGESWVTDAEYYTGTSPHASGADNSVFAARVKWSVPNKLATVDPRRRIVVLGDSITKGVRTGVAESETFGARLQASLHAAGLEIDVINQGIGGERTDQALARLNRDILSLEPEIVIVMYGTNDSYVDQGLQQCRISATQYRQNLEKIVTELRRLGIQPILMTEPRWGDKAGLNGVGEHPNVRLQEYVAECREVAEQTQTPLIDHFAAWSEANSKGIDIGTWTTDECHPNPAGHLKIAEALLPVVLKAVTDE